MLDQSIVLGVAQIAQVRRRKWLKLHVWGLGTHRAIADDMSLSARHRLLALGSAVVLAASRDRLLPATTPTTTATRPTPAFTGHPEQGHRAVLHDRALRRRPRGLRRCAVVGEDEEPRRAHPLEPVQRDRRDRPRDVARVCEERARRRAPTSSSSRPIKKSAARSASSRSTASRTSSRATSSAPSRRRTATRASASCTVRSWRPRKWPRRRHEHDARHRLRHLHAHVRHAGHVQDARRQRRLEGRHRVHQRDGHAVRRIRQGRLRHQALPRPRRCKRQHRCRPERPHRVEHRCAHGERARAVPRDDRLREPGRHVTVLRLDGLARDLPDPRRVEFARDALVADSHDALPQPGRHSAHRRQGQARRARRDPRDGLQGRHRQRCVLDLGSDPTLDADGPAIA